MEGEKQDEIARSGAAEAVPASPSTSSSISPSSVISSERQAVTSAIEVDQGQMVQMSAESLQKRASYQCKTSDGYVTHQVFAYADPPWTKLEVRSLGRRRIEEPKPKRPNSLKIGTHVVMVHAVQTPQPLVKTQPGAEEEEEKTSSATEPQVVEEQDKMTQADGNETTSI